MPETNDNDRLTELKEQIRGIDAEIAELEDERADAERELRRVRIEEYGQRAGDSTLSDVRGDILTMVDNAGDDGIHRQQVITAIVREYKHVSAEDDAQNVVGALLAQGELYEVDAVLYRT